MSEVLIYEAENGQTRVDVRQANAVSLREDHSKSWIPACAGMTRQRVFAQSEQGYLLAGGKA